MKFYCKKCRLIAGEDEPDCDCGKKRMQIDDGMAEVYLKRGYNLTPKESQIRLEEERAAEEARRREEERLAEEARRREEERAAEEARQQEVQRAAEEARQREEERLAEEARRREEERLAEEARQREEERLAEEARRREEERAAEEARRREEERLAEEARRREEERAAEEARRREEERSAEEARRREEERAAEEVRQRVAGQNRENSGRLPFEFGTDEPIRDQRKKTKIKSIKNNRISLTENIPWKGVGIAVLILSVILLIYIFRLEIMNFFVMLLQTAINILATGAIVLALIAAFIGWIRRAFRRW